jgi:hypothetical protein
MATGREIELVSFGVTQVEVFAKMLKAARETKSLAQMSNAQEDNK